MSAAVAARCALDALLASTGIWLDNILQTTGLLVGGLAWGIIADRYGRLKVLFGSILCYSLANLANAFVTDTTQYGVLRFVAGFGLAGELGGADATVAADAFTGVGIRVTGKSVTLRGARVSFRKTALRAAISR